MLFEVSEKDQKMKGLDIVGYNSSFISVELLVHPTDIHSKWKHSKFLSCVLWNGLIDYIEKFRWQIDTLSFDLVVKSEKISTRYTFFEEKIID